jgi:hypothetical protein
MPMRPSPPSRRIKSRKLPPIRCAFCQEIVPKPRKQDEVFSVEGCKGGRCSGCGAVFVLDEAGKHGGSALLDALAMACDGDMDRALALEAKVDYRLASIHDPRLRQNPHGAQSKIWFIELRKKRKKD